MPQKIYDFLQKENPQTPVLVVDLAMVAAKYQEYKQDLPYADVYYAVKSNPAPEILSLLVKDGACFDTASLEEIQMCLTAGATPDRISYGNTIKKERDIAAAYALGVRLFAFDSAAELEKLSRVAPGANVMCRILCACEGAQWPLSRKFGCHPDMAKDLLPLAKQKGLNPVGVSFHVGSQQTDPKAWDDILCVTADIFTQAKQDGMTLSLINLGGGFSAKYLDDIPSLAVYGQFIKQALTKSFGEHFPKIIIEPGRGLVGDAGILQSEVVLISEKSDSPDELPWVYLDIGKFGGLAETMDESIRYPIRTLPQILEQETPEMRACIVAGPTCDSVDVLYEKKPYPLPITLQIGDKVYFEGTGAYTTTYSAVAFNGFPPLKLICLA